MARGVRNEETRKAALALTAGGMSPSDAAGRLRAQGHDVAWRTIHRWEQERRAQVNARGGAAPQNGAAKPRPAAPMPVSPPLVAPAPSRAAQEAPRLPTADELAEEAEEALDAADRTHARLDALHQRIVKRIDDELALPEPDFRTLAPVTKLSLDIAVTLAKTRPPVAVKPEDDPANLEAAAALLERLDRLVADARRRVGLDVPATLTGAT